MSIIPRLVRPTGELICLCQRDTNGVTPLEKHKGRRFNTAVAHVAESVYYVDMPTPGPLNKTDSRWKIGILLSIMKETSKYIIGTDDGILKARSVRPIADPTVRWDIDRVKRLQGTPWQVNPGISSAIIRPKVRLPQTEAVQSSPRQIQIRGFRLMKPDMQQYGYTGQFPGVRCYENATA